MAKGPGAFADIGKKAKDLLFKDYSYDQKFTFSSTTASGIAFTSVGSKKGDQLTSELKTEYKTGNIKTEVKVDTKSKVYAVVDVANVAPGLKLKLTGSLPDSKTLKAEFTYEKSMVHTTASVGLVSQPVVEGAIAVGAEGIALGADFGYDTATNSTIKYNVGVGLTKSDFIASLLLADKLDTIKASYVHVLNKDTSVAVEVAHQISKKDITFTAGASHKLDPLTLTKVRLNNRGTIAGLLQHEFRPKSLVTLSGEVDSKNLDKSAKFGVSISLKP